MPHIEARRCSVDGCGEQLRAKGLCIKHYSAQHYAANRERMGAQTKAWYAANRETRSAQIRAWAVANRPRKRAANARWRAKNKDKGRVAAREYSAKLGGYRPPSSATRPEAATCECCGGAQSAGMSMCLDHCHVTGAFRGWLCISCNTAIGKLGDNVAGLQRAIDYLNRNASPQQGLPSPS